MILSLKSSSLSSSVPPVAFSLFVTVWIPSTGSDIKTIVPAFTFDCFPSSSARTNTVPFPSSFNMQLSTAANSMDG